MPQLTPEQLKDIYKKLPEDLKEAMFSVDSAETIQEIGKKYNLMIDKIGELADETGLVMLGLTAPRDYISHLAERLNVDKETAKKMAEQVNSDIFAKVRGSLKQIHGMASAPIKEKEAVSSVEVKPAVKQPFPATSSEIVPPTRSKIPTRDEIIQDIEKIDKPFVEEKTISVEPAPSKEDIIKDLEKGITEGEPSSRDEADLQRQEEKIPEVLKGTTKPISPVNPFDAKMKEEVFRAPLEDKKYSAGDPYREIVE